MKPATQWILGLGLAAATVYSYLVPGGANFQNPQFARIMLFHLPCAFTSMVLLIACNWHSLKYLRTKSLIFDKKSEAAAELCLTFIILTLLTGILFSKLQWGEWWHNDPRQTSFLLVALMMGSTLLLRMALQDPIKRAASTSAYNLAMLLPILFLTFVYPRLETVKNKSLHPSSTVPAWEFSPAFGSTFLVIWAGLLVTSFWLTRMRLRAVMAQESWEDHLERLDAGGAAAVTHMVRPVSVPSKNE